MTPQLLPFAPVKKVSLNQRLADYFKARPNRWIDGLELAKVGGCYGYRTRISNLRKQPFNMDIRNQLVRVTMGADTFTRSDYRYVPKA